MNICWLDEAASIQFGRSLVEQKNARREIIHELLERGSSSRHWLGRAMSEAGWVGRHEGLVESAANWSFPSRGSLCSASCTGG